MKQLPLATLKQYKFKYVDGLNSTKKNNTSLIFTHSDQNDVLIQP